MIFTDAISLLAIGFPVLVLLTCYVGMQLSKVFTFNICENCKQEILRSDLNKRSSNV